MRVRYVTSVTEMGHKYLQIVSEGLCATNLQTWRWYEIFRLCVANERYIGLQVPRIIRNIVFPAAEA
jgi:hypothetical protein